MADRPENREENGIKPAVYEIQRDINPTCDIVWLWIPRKITKRMFYC